VFFLGLKFYPRELGTNLIVPFASPNVLNFCNNGPGQVEHDGSCTIACTHLNLTSSAAIKSRNSRRRAL